MENVKEKRGNGLAFKIIMVVITIIVAGLIFFLFRNIIIEVLRYTKANDEEGLREFMRETGWLGLIAIPVIEALEMVVVFLPAEFIQIPAGLSFFFPVAVLLCDIGVCLGASIIYFLVHVLNVDNEFIKKRQRKINNIATKKIGQNTQILMYFLFMTPIIPFGAICYFASSRKISFRRYILTVATGVIPSIVTSILMGTSIKYFIARNLPIWALVLIIFGLGTILFIGMFLIAKKYLFNGRKLRGTPYSLWSYFASFLFAIYTGKHSRCHYIEDDLYDKMGSIPGPKIYLVNHLSPYDVYHAYKMINPDRPTLIGNRYYTRFKSTRFLMYRLGFVPKSLFNPDLETVKKMIKSIKDDTSILMFPEARLSIDGTTGTLTNGTANLLKKLGVTIVVMNIEGNYFAKSKYRVAKKRVHIQISVKRIIEKDELSELTSDELNDILVKSLAHNEFDYAKDHNYRDKNKAENLDAVLYHCPKCGRDYTITSEGNSLSCECGFHLDIDNHFAFSDNEYGFNNIHDYYEYIKSVERDYVNSKDDDEVIISQEVVVKQISFNDPKEDVLGEGVCTITKKGFSFTGTVGGKELSFSHSKEALQALAFSVNEEYECYYDNVLYYFYPKENKKSCTKVALIYDILHEE